MYYARYEPSLYQVSPQHVFHTSGRSAPSPGSELTVMRPSGGVKFIAFERRLSRRATKVLFRSRRFPEVGELVGGIDALQRRLLNAIAIARAQSLNDVRALGWQHFDSVFRHA